MKKRLLSMLMSMSLLLCLTGNAFAVSATQDTRASMYLERYGVVLSAKGSGRMLISMTVDGVGTQDIIGILSIDIEEKINGVWENFDTYDSVDHPEFWEYNSSDYMGTAEFYGTPGINYRVTLTVYAQTGTGSDHGYVTSYTITCK